ncbi:MAG: DUF4160 domain-containing protein [Rhodospirillales bacterium]
MVIKRFGKSQIAIYSKDHVPPHVHVFHTDGEALVEIETLKTTGALPRKRKQEILDYIAANRSNLIKTFFSRNPQLLH